MSVASQWKLKEKEAAAAAASAAASAAAAGSKTGIPGVKGKTEASARDVSSLGTVYGPTKLKGQVEKSGEMETAKLGAPQVSKPGPPQTTPFGKQGVSKLPVCKDTLKTKEADAAQTKDGAIQPVGATPSSKLPVGAKENTAVSVGGRKLFGAGLKKEEPAAAPAIRSKAEDNKAKSNELKKEPAGGAKDSATAAATAAGDDGPLGPGRTKGLAGFWANQNDEVKTVKKKRLTAVEDNLAPTVVENSPQQLEGVVRAVDPGEWKKPIEMEDGWTKSVVSSFQKRQQESFSKRAPISLVEDTSNEKSDAGPDAEAAAAKVKVKDISQRLTSQQSEPSKQVKEKLVIDRSQGAIVLAENQPMEVDPDVVRSDDASKEEVVLEKGRTRNLLQLWKDTEVEYNAPKTSTHRYQGSKPAWILEIEAAKGNSVDKNDEGQTDENDTLEVNDESGKIVNQYEERNPIPAATQHANANKQNTALDQKSCVPPPKELDKSGGVSPPKELDKSGGVSPPKELDKSGGVPPPKELDKSGVVPSPKELGKSGGVSLLTGTRDVETTKSSTLRTDETSELKLKENDETIKKEIPDVEISTAASLAIVPQVQKAEALPDKVPSEVLENTKSIFAEQFPEEILDKEARVEQSTEAPFKEATTKYEVSQQINEPEPIEGKEVSNIVPDERKPDSDVSSDAPSSSPNQNKTLQEISEVEKELQAPSTNELAPIHNTSEAFDQQNKLDSQQQVLPSESSSATLDKANPGERAGPHDEARPSPSTEIKLPSEFADVSHSILTDSENIGLRIDKSENEMALGRNEAAICGVGDVGPIQRNDSVSESTQNIEDITPSQSSRLTLTDDYVSDESPIKNLVPLPQDFPDHGGQPEVASHSVLKDVVKIQPQTNPVCEENKVATMIEDNEESSSDHEIFATPTKSVILSPLGSFVGATQDEPRDSETRQRTGNTGTTTTNEPNLNEGTLIDLQTESVEAGREKLSLVSLDDLLQIKTSPPRVDHSRPSDDNTPCLVPLSSPSTPEQNISSQRSSGIFDSDSDWYSPQEVTTVTTAKTETISTHDEKDLSSESLKSKTVGGNTSEQTNNKADASQRSCLVM